MTQARDLADGKFDTSTLVVDAANNRVGVGTASPSHPLHVAQSRASDVVGLIENTNTTSGFGLKIKAGGTDADRYSLRVDSQAGTELFRVRTAGGVTFNGDTAAANALDDYEEGTFNVTVSSGISVTSYDHDLGHYVKIGRQVTAWVFVEYNGSSRTGGHFEVSGLPFASSNDTSNEATMGGFITYQNNFSNAHNIIHMARNKTKVGFYELDGSQLIGSELSAASGEVRFVVQYTVA